MKGDVFGQGDIYHVRKGGTWWIHQIGGHENYGVTSLRETKTYRLGQKTMVSPLSAENPHIRILARDVKEFETAVAFVALTKPHLTD